MEIRQLRYFIAAAEAGNLRTASKNIHISHSALSMSIKNLENDLGVTLLHKNRKGVQMTFAGEQFLAAAHSLLRQIDDLRASLPGNADSPTGNVRLGIPYGLNSALAARLFEILLERYPGINLEIEEGNSTSLERLYEGDLIHLMISYDVVEKMDQKVEPLYLEQLYFVSEYDAALEHETEIELRELGDIPIVCSPGTNSMRTTLEKYSFENKIRFNLLSDFQSAHASLKIAEAGLANTISPWDEIYSYVEGKRITARKIVNPSMDRTVCLVSSLRKEPSFATTAIVGAIKESIDHARVAGNLRGEPVQ
jgi:LysR family nitrogen assimilation transcriptional regulator